MCRNANIKCLIYIFFNLCNNLLWLHLIFAYYGVFHNFIK